MYRNLIMNFYSLFNIEHLSNLNVPSTEKIESILNELLTPKLNQLGLSNSAKKYIWQSDYNSNGIKSIVRFSYRGTRGNLFVGTNCKFAPSITKNNELVYYNHKLHVFENSAFFDEGISISLWNDSFFKKSLKKYLDENLDKITHFIETLNSFEENISLLQRQLKSDKFQYKMQYPNPAFVLIYLYQKVGDNCSAKKIKEELILSNPDYKSFFSKTE